MISPSTYEVYTKTFPGWPEKIPYENLTVPTDSTNSIRSNSFLENWRPLSLAPQLTTEDLLKLLAYCCLFCLVLLYPTENERGFHRILLLAVLSSGLLVASIGVVQLLTWNGKILWFFVPYDWGAPSPNVSRASGPFIGPNLFANYLALIFPLSITGMLVPDSFVSWEKSRQFRLVCGGISFVLLMGILLSLSRGGWAVAAVGTGILFSVLLSLPFEARPSLLRGSNKAVVRFLIGGFVILLALVLFFLGPSGRDAIDVRLEQAVTQEAWWGGWTRRATE